MGLVNILITLIVVLVVLAIVYLIGREIIRHLGAPAIFLTILYLVMLLIVLLVILNMFGFLGQPIRLGDLSWPVIVALTDNIQAPVHTTIL